MNVLLGIFILLHGLVHVWYVTLSQGWVEFQADMGWTGRSWLWTGLLGDQWSRPLATVLYSLAAVVFAAAGIGLVSDQQWARPALALASMVSGIAILTFWDGSPSMPVQKGLIGLLISLGILLAVLVFDWPVV